MKIPTTLKHKPVVVAEDYENIDGAAAATAMPRACLWGLPNGTTGARWTYRPRSGGTRGEVVPAVRRAALAPYY